MRPGNQRVLPEPRGPRRRVGVVAGEVLGRLLLGALVPFWVWAAVLVLAIGIGLVVIVALAVEGTSSQAAQDWHYQCDSAIGPDPALTESAAPSTAVVPETTATSQPPTENPYAGMSFEPGDDPSPWDVACASALRSAPYQQPALQSAASGFAQECAGRLGVQSEGRQVAGTSATLTRELVYRASAAVSTGQCAELADAPGAPAAASDAAACARPDGPSGAVVLPNSVAAQGVCGQRVAGTAVSAGDLVFWDYRDDAPTRVGMALGLAQMVTVDPDTGRVVRESLPAGSAVRIKRVLRGAG